LFDRAQDPARFLFAHRPVLRACTGILPSLSRYLRLARSAAAAGLLLILLAFVLLLLILTLLLLVLLLLVALPLAQRKLEVPLRIDVARLQAQCPTVGLDCGIEHGTLLLHVRGTATLAQETVPQVVERALSQLRVHTLQCALEVTLRIGISPERQQGRRQIVMHFRRGPAGL